MERLREEVKKRDQRIAELEKRIGEKDKQIGEQEKQIADLEAATGAAQTELHQLLQATVFRWIIR